MRVQDNPELARITDEHRRRMVVLLVTAMEGPPEPPAALLSGWMIAVPVLALLGSCNG